MTKLKYCKDCVYSRPETNSTWVLRCIHPKVNMKDAWSLSRAEVIGSDCRVEREKGFFSFPQCGMSGKLYERA